MIAEDDVSFHKRDDVARRAEPHGRDPRGVLPLQRQGPPQVTRAL